MLLRLTLLIIFSFLVLSCSNDKKLSMSHQKSDPFIIYKDAMEAFESNDFFMLAKNFRSRDKF